MTVSVIVHFIKRRRGKSIFSPPAFLYPDRVARRRGKAGECFCGSGCRVDCNTRSRETVIFVRNSSSLKLLRYSALEALATMRYIHRRFTLHYIKCDATLLKGTAAKRERVICCNHSYLDYLNSAPWQIQLSLRGRRDDMPPPMAVRLAADLRPSADGSTVRTSLVAGQLQAADVPIA